MKGKKAAVPLKHDSAKVRLELIPPEFHMAVGRVLTFGAAKYAPGNWAIGEGFDWSRLIGAAERHIQQWKSGEDRDPESGESHIAHASCMMAFLIAHMERGIGNDDREITGVKRRRLPVIPVVECDDKSKPRRKLRY